MSHGEIAVSVDEEKLLAHTYKGIARVLGLSSLASAMHELEDILKKPRLEFSSLFSVWRSETFFPLLESYLEIGKISKGFAEESFANLEADIRKIVTERCQVHRLLLQQLCFDDSYIDWSPRQIDILSRAMVHIINNALDHGFITPRERGWSPPPVSLRLLAQRDVEGQALIRFYDNGYGLDRSRILQKAMQQGFVIQTEEDFQEFLFRPGTSTAHALSQTSGRGVGMTAVQSLLHNAGGRVRILSPEHGGTCIEMKLPVCVDSRLIG
jgi:chemotaxis protein histidine kinase CheA